MSEIKLRSYQADAIDAVFKAWVEGMTRPAVVLPTGAGKTVVFAHLIKNFRDFGGWGAARAPGKRVIVLVHRDELADQAIAKIRSIAPDLNVGKVKAAERQVLADVLVCSVQTLARGTALKQILASQQNGRNVGLLITDECHHAAAVSYKKVYDAFPDALQLGVTATMARGDGVGLGSTWEEVVYSRSILWMMSKGYLSQVRTKQIMINGLDIAGVKASRGDYQSGDLGRAMEDSEADEAIARAYVEHAKDRPGVVFTPTVATAELTAAGLNKAGIVTDIVSGETPTDERRRIFESFRTGATQVLANCMVLTEGFDAPWAEVAVIARPTMSTPLYTQMVGRVLRPYPGKTDALVLDMVGASAGRKLCTLIDLEPGAVRSLKEGESLEEAVIREAEEGNQTAPAGSIAFALKHYDVDMFSASDKVWLRTGKGVLFIGCGDTTVFLWPSPDGAGLWDVCTQTKGTPKWERTEHVAMDIGSAMAWGEVVAEDTGSFSIAKSAAWRRAKPSEGQAKVAERMGLDLEGKRRGDVSDLLSITFASRIFDRFA